MSKRKYQKINTLTLEKKEAYLRAIDGDTKTEIAKDCKVHPTTVSRWIKQVHEFMRESPQYQAALPEIANMIGKATINFHKALDKGDIPVSMFVYRMVGLMIERAINEPGDSKARMSEDEIRGKIKEFAIQDSQDMDKMTGKQAQNSKEGVYLDNSVKRESKEWR